MLYLPTWDNIILWIKVLITSRDNHYFDENEIEEGGKVNCNIVVSKPELSDEDKAELKEQAMEQYKDNMFLQNVSNLRMIIYALALILVMLFRPGGLLGTKELYLSKFFNKSKEGK